MALVPLLVALPLIIAAFLAGARNLLSRAAVDVIAIVAAAANLVMSLVVLHRACQTTIVYWFGNWYPRGRFAIGIGFVVDPAGAGMATLAALLVLLAMIFSWKFIESGEHHFHPLMLVFLAAMSGFAMTGDIFNLFVFFELMSTAAFALCGLKTAEPAPLAGAFNFAVTNTIAAFMVLNGIAMLYATTGSLNLAQIGVAIGGRHDRLVLGAFVFIASGFLVKTAAVPFHFWLPDAHAVSPTPVCVIFSGLMVELGLFGLLRVYATVFEGSFASSSPRFHAVFAGLGALTAIWGGVMCFAQHHLKRLLAFSTISHMGLMLIGFAGGTQQSIAGLFIYILSHALVKGSLFFTAGILLHRLRTVSEPALFGRGRRLHWTALLWFVGAVGLAGAPPFGTMLGDTLIAARTPWSSWIFIAASALTAGAVLRVGMRVFLKWGDCGPVDEPAKLDELPETDEEHGRIQPTLFLPPAFALTAATCIPFVPGLRAMSVNAAARLLDQAAYAQTVFRTGSDAVAVHAGLGMPLRESIAHGLVALLIAAVLAAGAVFHRRIPRRLRLLSHMEGPMRPMRALQSGHPGDYVAWLTVGTAALGGLLFLVVR